MTKEKVMTLKMTTNLDAEVHLTPKQLAERFGVPLQTVYLWNTKGVGPRRMRVGKHVRYRLADVLEWEESQLETDAAS